MATNKEIIKKKHPGTTLLDWTPVKKLMNEAREDEAKKVLTEGIIQCNQKELSSPEIESSMDIGYNHGIADCVSILVMLRSGGKRR